MNKYSWGFNKSADLLFNTGNSIEECLSEAIKQSENCFCRVYIGENKKVQNTLSYYVENIVEYQI